jgi:opacity protein-like surface antigen
MKRFFGLVVLVALLVSVGSAQQIGLKAIGGGIGYTSFSFSSGGTSESLGGFCFGAVANLGELTPGLSLYPSVIYSSASKDLTGGKWSLSDIAINANVKYSFPGQGVTPYVGGGLGLNLASSTVSYNYFGYSGEVSASSTKIGINILAGVEMKVSNMTGFVQAGYSLVSEMNHLQFMAGVMVPMN